MVRPADDEVMIDLLDPAAAAKAGARHGQMASGLAGGGLAISCQKLVEDASRSMLLLAPGLFRVDVQPVEDTLHVISRDLHHPPGRWEIVDPKSMSDYRKRSVRPVAPHRIEWDYYLDDVPLQGRISIASTVDWDRGLVHFVAHGVVREVTSVASASREP
jgi:hypothetical protein